MVAAPRPAVCLLATLELDMCGGRRGGITLAVSPAALDVALQPQSTEQVNEQDNEEDGANDTESSATSPS